MLLYYSLAAALPLLLSPASAQTLPADLVGTWSSKSNQTHTGPSFYDPFSDTFTEPERTGISYSFTADGFYEEAQYRAISNPSIPKCPGGVMQWQHGSWTVNATGSLLLTPIKVDGRMLLSYPCEGDKATFSRYNQSEVYQSYSQYTDPYHNIPRLDLFQFNGAPLQPLYLVFQPPQMLPTTTLSTPTATAATTTGASKVKRTAVPDVPKQWKRQLMQHKKAVDLVNRVDPDRLWWLGVAMTGTGGLLYFGARNMF